MPVSEIQVPVATTTGAADTGRAQVSAVVPPMPAVGHRAASRVLRADAETQKALELNGYGNKKEQEQTDGATSFEAASLDIASFEVPSFEFDSFEFVIICDFSP